MAAYLSLVAGITVTASLDSQEPLSNKAFREVLTTKEKWGCSDLNREPTDYESPVQWRRNDRRVIDLR